MNSGDVELSIDTGILENALVMIIVLDLSGRIRFWNHAAETITGYTSPEVTGRSHIWKSLYPDADYRRYLTKKIATILSERNYFENLESTIRTRSGETRVILWNTKEITGRDGTVLAIASGIDITRQKKAEEDLAGAEEMFRNPVELSPVGIYLIQDNSFVYANPRLAEIFGYSREEFLACTFGQLVCPEDLSDLERVIEARLNAEYLPGPVGFCGIKRDGSIISLEEYGSSMLYRGRPAVYGTITDITGRKRMEQQISDSLVEKEALLKEIHHRVRNNLQVITSLIALQERFINNAKSLTDIKEIRLRIGAMTLVHEIAHQENTPDSINMASLFARLGPRVIGEFRDGSHQPDLVLHTDPVQLSLTQAIPCSLIVTELVMNSMTHAFPDNRAGEISIGFSHKDGLVCLEYRDNGIGFPEGVIPEQAESAGLILIRGLVSQLSGTVGVRTRPGTQYSITFPM